ncbi:hypothetical protein MKX03_001256 [Papaver bracteatum]|nr:hypothetical protein MKX03_001256 [Papaver bracteatum]
MLKYKAIKFFSLPQLEKDKVGPANPFSYRNKKIGPNGDSVVKNYITSIKNLSTEVLKLLAYGDMIGFGEHTDPKLISVVRSNNITGLQIADKDGLWILVPPDQSFLFINNSTKSMVSMLYFGGPPLKERRAPLPYLLAEGEHSLYK